MVMCICKRQIVIMKCYAWERAWNERRNTKILYYKLQNTNGSPLVRLCDDAILHVRYVFYFFFRNSQSNITGDMNIGLHVWCVCVYISRRMALELMLFPICMFDVGPHGHTSYVHTFRYVHVYTTHPQFRVRVLQTFEVRVMGIYRRVNMTYLHWTSASSSGIVLYITREQLWKYWVCVRHWWQSEMA